MTSKRFVSWTVLCLAWMTLNRGEAGEAPRTEGEVVTSLIEEIDEFTKRDTVYRAVEQSEVSEAERWLKRTVYRLDDHLRTTVFPELFAGWREQFSVDNLRREVASGALDLEELRKRYKDRFSDVEEAFLNEIIAGDGDEDGVSRARREQKAKGSHAVGAVGRAIRIYVALRDSQDPEATEASVRADLKLLKENLEKYKSTPGDENKLLILKEIHVVCNRLRDRQQAGSVVGAVRGAYLRPKLRVYVSKRTLNKVTDLFDVSFPWSETKDGVTLNGTVSSRVQFPVNLVPSKEHGVFVTKFDQPLIFRGTARRNRICLGLTATINANLSKQFYLRQGLPDSERSRGGIGLGCIDTNRCRLVDRIVNRVAQRQFKSASMNAKVRRVLDHTVTEAANLVSVNRVENLQQSYAASKYPRERRYRTTKQGAEFILYGGSKEGFRDTHTLPPDATGSDFAISLHNTALAELESVLTSGDVADVADPVMAWFTSQFLTFSVHGGDEVTLTFPPGQQNLFRHGEVFETSLLAYMKDAPGEEFTIHIKITNPDHGEETTKIELKVVAGGSPAQRERLQGLLTSRYTSLADFVKIRLPGIAEIASGREVTLIEGTPRIPAIRLDLTQGYTTLSGRFKAE